MEIRDFRERNVDLITAEPEWHRFPGTNFALLLVDLSPKAWTRINKKSTRHIPGKRGQPPREEINNDKVRDEVYQHSIKGCRGLTPGVIKEHLKLSWPFNDSDEEEITFSSSEIMLAFLSRLGSQSRRLNRFIVDIVIPDDEEIEEDIESLENEKKTSLTGS